MSWICSLLFVIPAASAADDWHLGVAVGGGLDAGPVDAADGTSFRAGPVMTIPLTWQPRPGVGLRIGVELATAAGHDTVDWTGMDGDAPQAYYSDQHAARYTAERLLVGPEFALLPSALVSPYLGAGVGGGAVQTWHTFEGDTAALVETEGDHPSTMQAALAAAGWLGARIGHADGVALEVEAGYCVSFLPEAPLHGAPAALDATRTAWALDLGRLGVGLTFPL